MIVRQDLFTIIREGREFLLLLSNRHGDAVYQLDVASTRDLDDNTRIRSVTYFSTTGHEERVRLLTNLESKVKRWTEVIVGCRDISSILAENSSESEKGNEQILAQLNSLINNSSQIMDVQIGGCFSWMDKILRRNFLTLCHYIDHMDVSDIATFLLVRRSFLRFWKKCHPQSSQNDVSSSLEVDETAKLLMESLATVRGDKCVNILLRLFLSNYSSDMTPDSDYGSLSEDSIGEFADKEECPPIENVLNSILTHNQRLVLRVFYASIEGSNCPFTSSSNSLSSSPPKMLKGKKRHRSSWATKSPDSFHQLDNLFWFTFWTRVEESLVRQLVNVQECDDVLLSRIKKLLEAMSPYEGNDSPRNSLTRVYLTLSWSASQESWSKSHRKMISLMESFEENDTVKDNIGDHMTSKIGREASQAILSIRNFVSSCPCSIPSLPSPVSHCLTLTLNTLVNWMECTVEGKLSSMDGIRQLLTLIYGDLNRVKECLFSSSGKVLQPLEPFLSDVSGFQESLSKKIHSRIQELCTQVISNSFPRREYRRYKNSSSSNDSSENWINTCLTEALDPVMSAVTRLLDRQMNTDIKDYRKDKQEVMIQFLNDFLISFREVILKDGSVKFSSRGAQLFFNHVNHLKETLLSRYLWDEKQSNEGTTSCPLVETNPHLMELTYFSRQLMSSFSSATPTFLICPRSPKVSPVSTSRLGDNEGDIETRHRRLSLNCLFCLFPL